MGRKKRPRSYQLRGRRDPIWWLPQSSWQVDQQPWPKLCGVSRQAVYLWIKEWRVERLMDGIKLSRASGVPIEKLAGEEPKDEPISPQPKAPK